MSRKRRTDDDQQLAIAELAEQAASKAEAIRIVRHHLLKQGRQPETAEIATILSLTRWTTHDINRDKNYISYVLSQERTREGQPRGKPGRRPRALMLPAEPTAGELMRVRELGEQHCRTLQQLAEEVERVNSVASEVGGFDRLLKCIAFWRQLEDSAK
jgi:hypothetical protein